jgi:hypothetical protein
MFQSLYQYYVELSLQSEVYLMCQYPKIRLLALVLFAIIPLSVHLELLYLPLGEYTSQI